VLTVKDITNFHDSANAWDDDAIELYLDMNHDKSVTFENNDDIQLIVKRFDGIATGKGTVDFSMIGITRAEVTGGYTIDVSVPWSALNGGLGSQLGKTIGFDVAVDDDLNGSARDAQLMLYSSDQAFANTSAYGSLTLN
jgi:hypothetical protein